MAATGGSVWLCIQYTKHHTVIGDEVRNSIQGAGSADAKIVCDGGEILVHRLVLASASPWLKSIFEDVLPNSDLHHTILMPDIKYDDMLLLVRFIYGGEVTLPLKQLGTLQDLIQLLHLDSGHVSGKFVIENIGKSGVTFGGSTMITKISSSLNVPAPHPLWSTGGAGMDSEIGPMPAHVNDSPNDEMDQPDNDDDDDRDAASPKPEDLSVSSNNLPPVRNLNNEPLDTITNSDGPMYSSNVLLVNHSDPHETFIFPPSKSPRNRGGASSSSNNTTTTTTVLPNAKAILGEPTNPNEEVNLNDDDDRERGQISPPHFGVVQNRPTRITTKILRTSTSNASRVLGQRLSTGGHGGTAASPRSKIMGLGKRTRHSDAVDSLDSSGGNNSMMLNNNIVTNHVKPKRTHSNTNSSLINNNNNNDHVKPEGILGEKSPGNNNQDAIGRKNARTKTPHLQIIPESGVLYCSMCHYECTSYDDYKKHEKVHQPNFSCPCCNKRFFIKWNLIAHLRTHTGQKPFNCFFCKGTFRQKAHLIKHISAFHRYQEPNKGFSQKSTPNVEQTNEHPSSGPTNTSGETLDGKEHFSCCFCGELFENKVAIARHISQEHGDLFQCNP